MWSVTFAECAHYRSYCRDIFYRRVEARKRRQRSAETPGSPSAPRKKGKSHPETPGVYYCTYIEGTASQPFERVKNRAWSEVTSTSVARPLFQTPFPFPPPLRSPPFFLPVEWQMNERWCRDRRGSLNEFACGQSATIARREEPVFAPLRRDDGENDVRRVQGPMRGAAISRTAPRKSSLVERARVLQAKASSLVTRPNYRGDDRDFVATRKNARRSSVSRNSDRQLSRNFVEFKCRDVSRGNAKAYPTMLARAQRKVWRRSA